MSVSSNNQKLYLHPINSHGIDPVTQTDRVKDIETYKHAGQIGKRVKYRDRTNRENYSGHNCTKQ